MGSDEDDWIESGELLGLWCGEALRSTLRPGQGPTEVIRSGRTCMVCGGPLVEEADRIGCRTCGRFVPLGPPRRYEKVRKLGKGGFGEVWLARDTELKRDVAIKYHRAENDEERTRFRREARLAARIRHPNVVRIFEVGETYLVMEYVEAIEADQRTYTPREAADGIRQAAEGVGHAHSLGICHRDLKPANLLVSGDRVLVTDFGLAKCADSSAITILGTVLGTPAYMPPEQALGRSSEVGARSDVYSLGATLYHLLAGRPPFVAETAMEMIQLAAHGDPPPLATFRNDLDRPLVQIVDRAMAKDPLERYADGNELARDLARYLAGERPEGRGTIRIRARRGIGWVRRHAVLLALGIAAAAGIATSVALSISGGAPREPRPEEDGNRMETARASLERARQLLGEAELMARAPEPDAERLRRAQEEARRAAGEALRVDPRNIQGLRLRAEAAAALGDLASAEKDLTDAIALLDEPSTRVARAWILARSYEARGELPWPLSQRGSLEGIVRPVESAAAVELARRIEADVAASAPSADPRRRLAESVLLLARGDAAAAAAILDEAIEARPHDPDPWFHRALARTRLLDFPAAIGDLERVLAIRPASIRPLLALALCQFARADAAACRALLARAESLGAGRLDVLRLRAAVDAGERRFEEAFRGFAAVEEARPDDGMTRLLHYLARRAFLAPGDEGSFASYFPPARDAARELDAILEPALGSPTCPAFVHYFHGLDLVALGRVAEADAPLARAAELDPTLSAARLWRVAPAVSKGDWEAAAGHLLAFLEAPGRSTEFSRELFAQVLEAAGGRDALARLDRAVRAGGGTRFAPSFLLLMLGGDHRAARRAVDEAPEAWLRHVLSTHAAMQDRDLALARREAEAAVRARPESTYALRLLVEALPYGESEAMRDRLLALSPGDPVLQFNHAAQLLERGDLAAAATHLRRNTYFYSPKGLSHDRLGELAVWDPEGACRWETTIARAASPAALWYGLARGRFLRGELAAALEAADRAIEIDPDLPHARWVRGKVRLQIRRELPGAVADAEFAVRSGRLGADADHVLAACRWAAGDPKGAAAALEGSLGGTIRTRLAGGTWRFEDGAALPDLFRMLLEANDLGELESAAAAASLLDGAVSRAVSGLYLARAHEIAGRRDRMLAMLDEVLRTGHGRGLLHLVTARMYLDAERPDQARRILDALVEAGSGFPRLPWLVARCRLAQGDREGAARALQDYRRVGWSDEWSDLVGTPPSRAEFERLVREAGR